MYIRCQEELIDSVKSSKQLGILLLRRFAWLFIKAWLDQCIQRTGTGKAFQNSRIINPEHISIWKRLRGDNWMILSHRP